MIARYVQNNNCEVTQLEDEWIILHTDNYTVTKLNEVGGFCWELLKEAQSIDTIILAIDNNFHMNSPSEIVKVDVEAFLSTLLECGLIENVN